VKTLLVDLTSLDTPSRLRGQGRYVRELALGLSRLSRDDLGGVRLLGLTHLDLDGTYRVTEALDSFEGSPEIPVPARRDHLRWAYARRVGLFRAVRKLGVHAVHLGVAGATPLFMGLSGCRRIVTCHDTIPARFPERYMTVHDGGPRIGVAIEKRRYRSADLVVAISDSTRNDVISIYRVRPDRVVRVYNGVDVDAWANRTPRDADRALDRWGLAGRAFALYVGGLHWHKNVEGMVGGIAKARALGLDADLVWAGQLGGEHAASVRALARAAGVEGAVRFIGYVTDEEVTILYRAALAHTLVSRAEGFGLTVVEAMASGCPVITTSGGSLAEVAGDAALTVDPDDHAAIGHALLRLAREPELRRSLVERGRARAPRFSLAAQAKGMAGVYRRFLDA
jgi:glycosyltransferase involved in cell wall biosynthesis